MFSDNILKDHKMMLEYKNKSIDDQLAHVKEMEE